MGAWRDIDTVPDDKDVLVIGGTYEGEIYASAPTDGAYLVHTEHGTFPVKGTVGYSAYIVRPTHWHPVPRIGVSQ